MKRALDILVSALVLVVVSPLMGLIAIAIKLDSPGPVFFLQDRVGARPVRVGRDVVWERRVFRMIKFRSMLHGADESLHEAHIRAYVEGRVELSTTQETFKLADDRRITRVGRWLRRSSVDEIPQLLNVLKGDMSLVGPRPVPTYEAEAYSERENQRLNTWPGLTGWWQVYGRGRVTFDEMIQMDIRYVNEASIGLDLKLLALTVPAALKGTGAG
jgi:lipopolysaccharide/colanic/teichoic acid biosynthesis glycosyltransferase